VYGSSETAGVGWRNGADEDYRLFSYWQQADDPAVLVRRSADGRQATSALQDKLAWSGPDRFRPLGRLDHAVQVGGTNVFPGYVADVLRMHPAVEDAAVRLMRPDEGVRLKAFVIARGGVPADSAALRAELSAWIAARLSTPECPAAYSFGPALPRQASGKPTDWIIDAWP
jgi:4-coumarate--CoA ligase